MKDIVSKFKDFYSDNEEEFNFSYVMTTLIFFTYIFFWTLNYVLVTFIAFTGLKFIILPWVGWSVGRCIAMWHTEYKLRKVLGEQDEHRFL